MIKLVLIAASVTVWLAFVARLLDQQATLLRALTP